MLVRRVFARPIALAAAFFPHFSAVAPADEVVRIMAANITSGSAQSYDPGHGNRIFDGLNPDIALVQEMNVGSNSAADYREWVDDWFGSTFSYHVESGKSIPNGIVSRFPIVASGVWNDPELSDREFVWARIDLPGDKNLLAVSVHLKASSGSDNVARRRAQAEALVDYIAVEKKATDHVVIGGDFNTYSRTESCLTALSATVVTTAPWPVDQAGNTNTNSGQTSPYDWVAPGASLAALSTPLVIGPNTHADGLVFDSRDYTPLSAVSPVQSGDSGASGMQHMAVVRAFLIPTNEPPVITAGPSVAVTLSRDNSPVAFSRSLSATDADGDPLAWSVLTSAAHGTAGIVAPASGGTVALSYVPAAGYTGSDSFVVRVSDGQGGTDTITVNLAVQPPPNGPPAIEEGPSVAVTLSRNNTPVAFSRSLTATDADGNPLSWTVSTAASHGSASIVAPATGGSVALGYVPETDYVGGDSFTVRVSDGQGGTDFITVNLTIEPPPNVAPVIAQGDSVSVVMSRNGYPSSFGTAVSATDADGDALSWALSAAASRGTASVTGGGGVSYQPEPGYVGADSFQLSVSDGRGGQDEILVQVTVAPPPAYDGWTEDAFAPLIPETEATVWGEGADPDGDGVTNLEEFAQGTDPEAANAEVPLLTVARTEEGDVLFSYLIRLDGAVPALDYGVEVATEFPDGWELLESSEYDDAGTVDLDGGFQLRQIRLTAPLVEGARFFRLTFTR